MNTFMKKICGVILVIIAYIGCAILGGRICAEMISFPAENVRNFILGEGMIAGAVFAWGMAQSVYMNAQSWRKIWKGFPATADELRSLGVKTPKDFACRMSRLLGYYKYSPVNQIPAWTIYSGPILMRRAYLMFVEMFGRAPTTAEQSGWTSVKAQEFETASADSDRQPQADSWNTVQEMASVCCAAIDTS